MIHTAFLLFYLFALALPGMVTARWLWVLGMEPTYAALPQYYIDDAPVTLDWRGYSDL